MDGRKKRRKKAAAGESRLRRRRCQSAKYRGTDGRTNMNKIFQKERKERGTEHLCFCCRKKGSSDGKTFRRRKALSRTNTPRRRGRRLLVQSHERRKEFGGGRKERGEGQHLHNSTSKCLLRPRTRINAKPVAPHPYFPLGGRQSNNRRDPVNPG